MLSGICFTTANQCKNPKAKSIGNKAEAKTKACKHMDKAKIKIHSTSDSLGNLTEFWLLLLRYSFSIDYI